MITKQITSLLIAGVILINGAVGMTDCSNAISMTVSAAEANTSKYTVNITLMQFHSEEKSMGNESMKPEAHIVVAEGGSAQIQIDMTTLTYLNQLGYLGSLTKVTSVLEENKYHYPTKIETEDATVLEESVCPGKYQRR